MLAKSGARRQSALDQPPACPHFVNSATSRRRAAGAERLADEALAVVVALGRVDHVQPGIERLAEQPRDGPGARILVADLGAAETEHAAHDVGAAEPALLHPYPRGRRSTMDRHVTIGAWRR